MFGGISSGFINSLQDSTQKSTASTTKPRTSSSIKPKKHSKTDGGKHQNKPSTALCSGNAICVVMAFMIFCFLRACIIRCFLSMNPCIWWCL